MLFCKTTTLITAVPFHDMNQGSTRTNVLSIKTLTPYLLHCNFRRQITTPPHISNCCSISHSFTCLLHNLKRHYHVQRSFPHLPIRGQTNPVHISHSTRPVITSKLEMIMLMLLMLWSVLLPMDIRNHP
jgi:hypothetical protein